MAARLWTSSIDDASTSGSTGYIEHTVSKLDTLAGVAIKYGVEVADIKRLNALTTDFQMYALKTLRIPLPAKHCPSDAHKSSSGLTRHASSSVDRGLQYLASGSQSTSNNGIGYRFPEKRTPTSAMGLLRGYYGLESMSVAGGEGTEMDVYETDAEFPYGDQPYTPRAHNRRHSTGGHREFAAFGFAESCDTQLNTLWSSLALDKLASDSSLLLTPSKDPLPSREIEVVNEAERQTDGSSVRRRSKVEMGSDEVTNIRERVTLLMKGSQSRPKEPTANFPLPRPGLSTSSNGSQVNNSDGVGASSGMKISGAAVRTSKGAADNLISKVRRSAGATSLQDVAGSIITASPSLFGPTLPGPSSIREGLTSAVRRSKAALD